MSVAETDAKRCRAAFYLKYMEFAWKTTSGCTSAFAVISNTTLKVNFDACCNNEQRSMPCFENGAVAVKHLQAVELYF